jgi:hypothetical protein
MHVQEHVTGREVSLHVRVWLMKKDFVLAQHFSKKKEMRFRHPSTVASENLNTG